MPHATVWAVRTDEKMFEQWPHACTAKCWLRVLPDRDIRRGLTHFPVCFYTPSHLLQRRKRQPYHMKAQASYILFTAALLGFAKAGWEASTRTLNYNAFCGRRPHPPADVGYVCLQTKFNAEGFTRESDFRGFLQSGKQSE